jgi:hypothetical protein
MRKRIALKYCGGCDSTFDRVEFFRRIRAAAGDSVEWVTLDDPDFDAILLISGCQAACIEQTVDCSSCDRVVSVRDDGIDPGIIAQTLLR